MFSYSTISVGLWQELDRKVYFVHTKIFVLSHSLRNTVYFNRATDPTPHLFPIWTPFRAVTGRDNWRPQERHVCPHHFWLSPLQDLRLDLSFFSVFSILPFIDAIINLKGWAGSHLSRCLLKVTFGMTKTCFGYYFLSRLSPHWWLKLEIYSITFMAICVLTLTI